MTIQDRLTAWLLRHLTSQEPERYISVKSLAYWTMVDHQRRMEGKEW